MTITPITTIDFSTPFWQEKYILIDSRKLLFPKQSIFFALKGNLTNGHAFIPSLYQQGLRAFVISQPIDQNLYPEATFILVDNVVTTMQAYAQYHRSQFDIPIIAITGSNGKTILKEWLSLLLEQDFVLVKSPKSYNSQIGVPMSIMGINARHELGIFEAGISQVGEMQHLAKIIQPNIGIFTNIGKAHASGFDNLTQKIQEKLLLFKHCQTLIYRIDHTAIHEIIQQQKDTTQLWSWGASEKATLPIYTKTLPQSTLVQIHWQEKIQELNIPFTNTAAIENCLHGIATLIYLGIPIQNFSQRIAKLQDVPMRLEIKEGINNCHIVDDSYNNDLEGLKIALDFLNQKHKNSSAYTKTLILSDIPEAKQFQLYPTVAQLIQKYNIQKFIGIGEDLQQHANLFHALPQVHFFKNTSAFIQQIGQNIHFHQESILLKGARSFEFERIAQQLKKRIHMMTSQKQPMKGAYLKGGLSLSAFLLVFIMISCQQDIEITDTIAMTTSPPLRSETIKFKDEPLTIVEHMPRFPGCEDINGSIKEKKTCADQKFLKFIYDNIKYPKSGIEQGIEGMTVVNFIVTTEGKLVNAKMLRSIGKDFDTEVFRIIHLMNEQQTWTPGKNGGKLVNVSYNVPIRFKLEQDKK